MTIIKARFKTRIYIAMAFVCLVLLVLNLYIVKTLDIFGSPLFFALSLLIEVVLLVILAHSLLFALVTRGKALKSIALSGWRGIIADPNIKKLRATKSPALLWLGRRLSQNSYSGFALTITLIVAGFFFASFVGVLQDVLFKHPLIGVDTRVVNLVPSIRTATQTNFFAYITFVANIESVLVLLALLIVVLWRNRQKSLAVLFSVVAVIEEVSTYTLKHLVGRVRPEQALSLIREDSYSFPSGHVMRATVLFGLLAYLLYKASKSSLTKLLIAVSYVVIVFLVALSRIYLGVHYPSDVLASTLFGGFLLALVIGAIEIANKYDIAGIKAEQSQNRNLVVIPLLLAGFVLVFSSQFIKIAPITGNYSLTTIKSVDENTIKQLPLFSETLTGVRMEPINFVYVGTESQIVAAFTNRGWYRSDPSTISNTLRAVAVGYQGGQYLKAPVTPSYLNARPETVAFEKPTESNSLRQRHHTRLWRTDFILPDKRPIWLATASLDEGVELAGSAKLPTHHINPNIDAERAYITESLDLNYSMIQVATPQQGKNASGDSFFTDGRAVVITFEP